MTGTLCYEQGMSTTAPLLLTSPSNDVSNHAMCISSDSTSTDGGDTNASPACHGSLRDETEPLRDTPKRAHSIRREVQRQLPRSARGVACFVVGFVIVSLQQFDSLRSHGDTKQCCQQRQLTMDQCHVGDPQLQSHHHVDSSFFQSPPSLFTWLFVEAFGVIPSITTTNSLTHKLNAQCNGKWGQMPRCYSSTASSGLASHGGALSQRRWQKQQQRQRCHPSTSFIICRSTINGEVAEAKTTVDDLHVSLPSSISPRKNISKVHANGVNDSLVSVASNGSHSDQFTSTPNVFNKNDLTSGESLSISPQANQNLTSITQTSTNDPATATTTADPPINDDVPHPTAAGGYTHTTASRAKISAANKGKTPWNKGKSRSDEVRARIAEGVRRRNRERFLAKLQEEGITEEEYEQRKKEQRRKAEAERRARKTENGGYKPTEETKKKISTILKEKYANGEIVRAPRDPSSIRRGFKHSEETKAKIAETLRRKWAEDTEYREYMTNRTIANEDVRNAPSVRARIAETLKKKWKDPEFRESMIKKFSNRRSQSRTKAMEHRQKISDAMKRKWMDEEYRKRAMDGMLKGRESAGPKLVKPVQSKGLRKLDPLKNQAAGGSGVKKKKKKKTTKSSSVAKRKKGSVEGVNGNSSPLVPLEPISLSPSSSVKESPSVPPEEEELEPEGSIQRLRKERRDLYDLLYGDDEDEVEEHYDDSIDMDVSFTSLLLNGLPHSSNTKSDRVEATKKDSGSKRPVLLTEDKRVNGRGSKFASLLADDEDLDDFDPYGLKNF
ncbi:hypothetical protein HJC23_002791 [Cyclotella cryptica]|uniref:Nuclease associated modular domain-containing protein n=1 Tax=Cyclotella cryptica TaxID=29204 RepID=A0ABD3PNE9_9STRA|eukprot:CCRYP_013055-RA/>CCRYP_013055-RA protein AED:0.29 eAED:0.29 QI:0/-1/0/1/-1/1/1/0/782